MNKDDTQYFKAVADISELQKLFLESWKKDPKNQRKKELWESLARIDASHSKSFERAKYYYEAATEREHTIGVLDKEVAVLQEHIRQLKESESKLLRQIEEWKKEYSV